MRLDEFTEVVVSPKTRDFAPTKNTKRGSVSSGDTEIISQRSNQPKIAGSQHTATSFLSTSSAAEFDNQLSVTSLGVAHFEKQTKDVDSGFVSRFSGYLRTLFHAHGEETTTSETQTCKSFTQKENTSNEENLTTNSASSLQLDENVLEETDFDMCLRVQPELSMDGNNANNTYILKSTSMTCYALQPLAVFIDFTSLPSQVLKSWTCNLESFPPPDGMIVKTVQISKLLSPKERAAFRTNSAATNSHVNAGSRSQEPAPNNEDETSQG